MVTLEKVKKEEIHQCYEIVDSGRKFQREQGFVQWTDDYPNYDSIRDDVMNQKGYAVKVDGTIAGYMCIAFDGEPTYRYIEGRWTLDAPYAVIHRIAFSEPYRGVGLADIVWNLIEEYCRVKKVGYIRMDTDFPNTRMQHILEKNGYQRCGIIYVRGSGRIAYDKVI
ncbi:MAG: GNAT family N-acetyltransferase [Clostridiales bacterium]|nr:GNAT family N-acetyltransferase [Clostridiales bacterium]